jgi:AGCS family alanine or glycine:cation symporter
MAFLYIGSSLYIIGLNYDAIVPCFKLIIKSAFQPEAAFGGFIGVMMTGIKRASFSNEAGIGSASIAHSAVKTKYPSSEGIVSLLEPFIDTVVICTMTALVILITNTHQLSTNTGISLTSDAFASQFTGAEYILLICALLFAFSTMISWSYYGLKSWEYLFGRQKISGILFKLLFCSMIVIGASSNMHSVIDFSDCMILAMSFPNVIGMYLLAPKVKYLLNHYVEHMNLLKKSNINK